MRIGLLSDTHGELDPAVFEYLAECDEVWHAGDLGSIEVLEGLMAFKPVRAVYGNIDGADLRLELKQDLEWDCEGVTVYMTHIGGYPGNYDRRANEQIIRREPDLFVCGHSHILRVDRDRGRRMLCMNPGACGFHGWHLVRTLLRFTVAEGKVSAVEAVELGPRARGGRPKK